MRLKGKAFAIVEDLQKITQEALKGRAGTGASRHKNITLKEIKGKMLEFYLVATTRTILSMQATLNSGNFSAAPLRMC